MRHVVVVLLLSAIAAAAPVDQRHATYVGGTVPGLKPSVQGRLDTQRDTALVFEYDGGRVAIPYAQIDSFDSSSKLAHPLGILPMVAIALVKRPQRRHFVRISFRDARSISQVAIFEIPKQMSRPLSAVLEARAPRSCHTPPRPCRSTVPLP